MGVLALVASKGVTILVWMPRFGLGPADSVSRARL